MPLSAPLHRRSKETLATATLLPTYVVEFRSMFAKEDFNILPEHHKWDHTIELIPGVEPKSLKVYPLSPLEQAELDVFLEENLHIRRIQPSKSSIAAPMFFIKKKDGSLRLVQDYRILNTIIMKNRYPLPLVSELVAQLHRAQYFMKLDICWGFNNVHIKPRDEWKTAFCTNHSLFKPLMMFFGMTNSSAVTPQVNFPQKITFDMLYTNEFIIRVHSRALSIPSERNTI